MATAAKWIVGVAILFVLALAAWNIFFQPEDTTRVQMGDTTFLTQVAATDEDRQRGLSGTRQLQDNRGMLFVYGEEDTWGIWMKDMHIDLDIIWLDADKRVVHIVKNATPDTYPQIFRPEKPAQYVLEINAGLVDRRNIQIGTRAQFELPEGIGVQ